MTNIERFRFVTYKSDPDYIYLDNPSPMSLCSTRIWFKEVIGKENVDLYQLGGFFEGFCNAFKYKKEAHSLVQSKIVPELVEDEGFYRRRETMDEANLI